VLLKSNPGSTYDPMCGFWFSLEGGRRGDLVSGREKSRQRGLAMRCRGSQRSSMKTNEFRRGRKACSFRNSREAVRWAPLKRATRRIVP
jgi:hypothetical protein